MRFQFSICWVQQCGCNLSLHTMDIYYMQMPWALDFVSTFRRVPQVDWGRKKNTFACRCVCKTKVRTINGFMLIAIWNAYNLRKCKCKYTFDYHKFIHIHSFPSRLSTHSLSLYPSLPPQWHISQFQYMQINIIMKFHVSVCVYMHLRKTRAIMHLFHHLIYCSLTLIFLKAVG